MFPALGAPRRKVVCGMSKRKRAKDKSESKPRTRLQQHRREGRTLLPPLAQLPISPVNWLKDLIPEFLWLDSVIARYDAGTGANILHTTLNLIDRSVPSESQSIATGLVSSFELVPTEHRLQTKQLLQRTGNFDRAFSRQFLSMIANYPACPMAWVLSGEDISGEEARQGVEFAKEAVLRLFASRGKHSSRCRMIPIARLLKHRKLAVTEDASEMVELLSSYSDAMDEEKQRQAESVTRALFLSIHAMYDLSSGWPGRFWRHNYSISPCQDKVESRSNSPPASRLRRLLSDLVLTASKYVPHRLEEARLVRLRRRALNALSKALSDLMEAFNHASKDAKLDTYELDRDDVLFGLISRQFHLYFLVANDTRLWIPEYGLLFHRVIADTHIILAWLAKRNDIELYRRFKMYSLGKQKLYMLHLEEIRVHSGLDTEQLEEMISDRISEEILEEFLPIELGAAFEGMSIRDMAIEIGLKGMYDLVYAPTSSEIHGEWSSLKEYALGYCANPLHRLHRLPRLLPALVSSPTIPLIASSILADSVRTWLEFYGLYETYSRSVTDFRRQTEREFVVDTPRSHSDDKEA